MPGVIPGMERAATAPTISTISVLSWQEKGRAPWQEPGRCGGRKGTLVGAGHIPDAGAPVVYRVLIGGRWDVFRRAPDVDAVGVEHREGVITPAHAVDERAGEAHVGASAGAGRLDAAEGLASGLPDDEGGGGVERRAGHREGDH